MHPGLLTRGPSKRPLTPVAGGCETGAPSQVPRRSRLHRAESASGNGSGSAPILVQHPQYTALGSRTSRAFARRAFVFDATRWDSYELCFLLTRSALAGEDRNTTRPIAETTNPAQRCVILTVGMAALPAVEDVARQNMASLRGNGQRT